MKNRNKSFDAELAALARKRDEDIDTSDIPEVKDWSGAVIGKFYRPVKEAVSIRLDADVLAWFKGQGCGYQTRINEVLRRAMASGTSAAHNEGDSNAGAKGLVPGTRCRRLRFPALERHGELGRCGQIAESISERSSFFAVER
ncbi:MAG: BrnA antitoxin family protein [Candidatus Sulfotelmatobacter sp.]